MTHRIFFHHYVGRTSKKHAWAHAGMQCPRLLSEVLATNGLRVDPNTSTDGNCGVHGFAISVLAAGRRDATLRQRGAYKEFVEVEEACSSTCRAFAKSWLFL